jgi:hypothetical protein
VSKCSSVNSILFYIPWLYTSLLLASRCVLFSGVVSTLACRWRPITSHGVISSLIWASRVGLYNVLFGVGYEMLGPQMGWWRYTQMDLDLFNVFVQLHNR